MKNHDVYTYAPIFGMFECSCGKRFPRDAKKLFKHIRKHKAAK